MANIGVFGGKVINIIDVNIDNKRFNLPIDLTPLGNIKYKGYDITTPVSIVNEPKMYCEPFSKILLTNNQFPALETDLGYIYNSTRVEYLQNLDILYKVKLSFNNYGLGDSASKFHRKVVDTISEVTLSNDAYVNYLQNNKLGSSTGILLNGISTAVSTLSGAMIAGAAMGPAAPIVTGVAVTSSLVGGVTNVANALIKKEDIKNVPVSIDNIGSNLLYDYTNKNIKLFLLKLTPEERFLNRAFKFINMYGYRTDDIKVPDIRSRFYFNFIKTKDINLKGTVPKRFLDKIKMVYNNGIHIWHYRENNQDPNVGNFQYENKEVSLIG